MDNVLGAASYTKINSMMPRYEWDEKKNKQNIEKHGVSFEDASGVFADEDRIVYPGSATSKGESRFLTVGKLAGKFMIAVVYTIRLTITRIISARSVRKKELQDYLKNKLDKDE